MNTLCSQVPVRQTIIASAGPPLRCLKRLLPNTSRRLHSDAALLGLVLACLASCLQAWGQYAIDWSTFDGGGGTSTGGPYRLSSTIGQPDAGTLSGGQFTLRGGFWGIAEVQPGPPLMITLNAQLSTVAISWPVSATDWRLQTTPSLAAVPVQWTEVPPPYPTLGTNCWVVEPVPPGSKFYRLRSQ